MQEKTLNNIIADAKKIEKIQTVEIILKDGSHEITYDIEYLNKLKKDGFIKKENPQELRNEYFDMDSITKIIVKGVSQPYTESL